MLKKSVVKDFLNIAFVTIVFLGLALFAAHFASSVGFEHIPRKHLINVSLDIFGMMLGYVLLLGIYLDKRKTGGTAKYLVALIIVIYIAMFTDAIEYISDCVGDFRTFNVFANTVFFIMGPAEAICFWHYTIHYLDVKNSSLPIFKWIVNVGFVLSVIIRIANIKYGFYFIVDAYGEYHRGPYYIVSKIFFIIMMLFSLAVVFVKRRQLRTIQLVAVFMYAIAPITIGITSIYIRGISFTPITSMIVALFMYCALNVTQGREIAVAENEVAVASSIQENVLPKTFPYLPNRKEFDLFAIMKPAKEVGGDFYDFFMVDDNHLALVIADVSGKGIPAALFMMTSRTLIKNRLQAGDSLSEVLADANNQLCEGNVADLFVTVWIGIIDLRTGHCVEVNAGHEYPILGRAGGQYEVVLSKHDIAVAMFEDQSFTEHEFTLNPGDTIFVYTDGVTEAMNPDDEIFTKERLVATLNSHPDASPKAAIETVLQAIDDFAAGAEQFDDTTMLCMKYNGAYGG
ncbi:PP2C family protein-serine/threonine phosphatase [Pseudobutyrivibrio sp.]|uniref:PP2C family protein-serine/threonine phosphatase n=1 Tax=Pseudobutyrivibrio sp. TaxID=2014367 RepID=UPI0025DC677F|nr:SpoIIE family protein phosphatase [Pseudobutyrivibrio sp.]